MMLPSLAQTIPPASTEVVKPAFKLPAVVEVLAEDISGIHTPPVTSFGFWADFASLVIDYSLWTPELDSITGVVVEQVADTMGLFSTTRRFRISSLFGSRFHPILKRTKTHNGIDLAAPTGTPVRAVEEGTVSYAGWKGGYGQFVAIEHKRPWTTQYAHLSSISVLPGENVEQGDKIGKVGTTGRSTGPHLHFIVRKDGVAIDPLSAEGFYYISPIVPLSYNLALLKKEAATIEVASAEEM